MIEGSELAADYPALTWSRSGDWLFFHAGGGRLMAYRPSSPHAVTLPVDAGADVIDIVTD